MKVVVQDCKYRVYVKKEGQLSMEFEEQPQREARTWTIWSNIILFTSFLFAGITLPVFVLSPDAAGSVVVFWTTVSVWFGFSSVAIFITSLSQTL